MAKYPESSPSIIDKKVEQRKAQKKVEDAQAERLKEYKRAINGVFNTPNGRVLWSFLLDFCGVWHDDPELNPAKLIEQRGKRMVVTTGIKPLLEQKVLNKLEQ